MATLLIQSLAAFFFTLVSIAALAKIAGKIGLVDLPTSRKRHSGSVPLVGGIAITCTLLMGIFIWADGNTTLIMVKGKEALWIFMGCAVFLVIAGALDDLLDLGVFVRVGSEVLVALTVIEVLDLRVGNLGNLLSFGTISLTPFVAYPFTVIAIFGVINAFNMLDGVDGLLASLVLLELAAFHIFTETSPGLISLFVGGSLLAFLVSNLELTKFIPKTFLGDAGSRLLGFIVVCMLLAAASDQVGKEKIIQPATALFLIALPLFDMVFITVRRVLRGASPFSADRGHIHHLLQDLGFSDRRALVFIIFLGLSLNLLGLMLHRSAIAEHHQFAIYCGSFALYCLMASQAWRVVEEFKETTKTSVASEKQESP